MILQKLNNCVLTGDPFSLKNISSGKILLLLYPLLHPLKLQLNIKDLVNRWQKHEKIQYNNKHRGYRSNYINSYY